MEHATFTLILKKQNLARDPKSLLVSPASNPEALHVPLWVTNPLPPVIFIFFLLRGFLDYLWIAHYINRGLKLQTHVTTKHYCRPLLHVDKCALMNTTCCSMDDLADFLYFLCEVHSSVGQLFQSYSCSSFWVLVTDFSPCLFRCG